jgi:enoyl-CoA hydratase/carnithine racemase
MEHIWKTEKELAIVKDGTINYLVMNQTDNKFSIDWINNCNRLLDEVEAEKGPGCLITVATGPKVFHTGFDLEKWKKDRL